MSDRALQDLLVNVIESLRTKEDLSNPMYVQRVQPENVGDLLSKALGSREYADRLMNIAKQRGLSFSYEPGIYGSGTFLYAMPSPGNPELSPQEQEDLRKEMLYLGNELAPLVRRAFPSIPLGDGIREGEMPKMDMFAYPMVPRGDIEGNLREREEVESFQDRMLKADQVNRILSRIGEIPI